MSLTAISTLESERREFLMNPTYILSRNSNQTFFAEEDEMNLTAISTLESARRKFFLNSTENRKYVLIFYTPIVETSFS